MKDNLTALLIRLQKLDMETPWSEIAIESGVVKQIEIRAEIGRAMKRVEKERSLENPDKL